MGPLVSEMYGNNLVDRDIGSAVRTFRKNESLKSKFPNKFWEQKYLESGNWINVKCDLTYHDVTRV